MLLRHVSFRPNQAGGAGIQVGVGAGVGIFTGCTFVTNGGLFSFFGSGVHQFLGAGVLINTGVTTNLNLGVGKCCAKTFISSLLIMIEKGDQIR